MGLLDRTIYDSRGGLHAMYGSGLGATGWLEYGAPARAAFLRARGRLRRNWLHSVAGSIGVSIQWWFLGLLMLLVALGDSDSGPIYARDAWSFFWGFVLFILVPLAAYGALAWRGLRPFREEFVAAAMLAERCCPACGYDLTGITGAEDGCTVCVECGAAWRFAARPCARCAMDLEENEVRTIAGRPCCRRCGKLVV